MKKNFLLKIGVTNESKKEVLEYILQGLEKQDENYYIVTPNPEILVYASNHPSFRSVLNNARLALCDGVGVFWAGSFLGKPFKERVTGVDLMESLCREVSKRPITVGFLGGGDKIAELTAECLVKKYPGLKVGFAGKEWPSAEVAHKNLLGPAIRPLRLSEASLSSGANFLSSSHHSNLTMKESAQGGFKNKAIDILFVAFGFPKQEEWMAQHIDKVPINVMMGVGGSFDYISGKVSRAPVFMQRLGFEWLFRLMTQPWRIKRQLALVTFIWLIIKERLAQKP